MAPPDAYVDPGCTQPVPIVDLCEKCGRPWEIGMWPTCKGNPQDHGAQNRYSPFPAFEVEGHGVIDSITKLRRVEQETMRSYKNGEGAPLVFRAFTQDRSNSDQNVFGRREPEVRKRPNIQLRKHRG